MTDVRDHLTERLTSGRVKLEAKRSRLDFAVLLFGFGVALLGAGYIFSHVAPTLVKSSREVSFTVDSARAVRPGLNDVRVKGVPAGRISGVKLQDGKAVVTVKIEKKYGPIYNDAKAELRPNSALEDQFLDVVDRGTPATGEARAGHPLPPSQTSTPVAVDDVLNVFNGRTRARLRVLLADLGQGLDDNGQQLGDAFVAATPLLKAAEKLTQQLARRKANTERLIHNTGILTGELARRDVQVRTLVRDGSTTLATLQAGSGDLDATLRALPPTLSRIDSSFTATRGVLGDVNRALASLEPVAGKLPPALTALRALSADARPALAALQAPVRRLVPLSRSLKPLSASLASAVAALRPQIDTVDHTTRDLVLCKKGIQGFFQWDASMTKYGDSRGQAPRGNLVVGLQTAGLPSPEESAYQGCTPGGPIGGRVPTSKDER
ncbi:MAG: Mammalian cell entry related domain protein [Solirubrobacterales bacterium]|nr:Mammalian cell entry related domain protein [Solirubrobacterales bacterium]